MKTLPQLRCAALALITLCALPLTAAADEPPAPAPAQANAAPLAAPEGPCGEELYGARPLLSPGGLLLLGEMPGSEEIPAFVGRLACIAVADGVPVQLDLELPREVQPELDRYLGSAGTAEDLRVLLSHKYWSRMYQDGRSSQAIVALIERARAMKARGQAISVLAYDVKAMQGNERQAAMAQAILSARQGAKGALTLILSGNVQARTVGGTEWEKELLPLGARLLKAEPGMKSLDAQYSGGSAWTCKAAGGTRIECGAGLVGAPQRNRVIGRGVPSARVAQGYEAHRLYVRLDEAPSPEGYHGTFYVGRLTASPPAVAQLQK